MKRLLISVLLFGFIFSTASPAFAYNYWTNKAKLKGNVNSEQYYISHETFDGRGYGVLIDAAVKDWNDSMNSTWYDSTNVYFTRESSRSSTEVDFMMGNYGSTGWNGITNFYIFGEGQINPEPYGPSRNYDYAIIKMNDSYINGDTQAQIKATAKHEFGHALGLAHSGYLDAIMYKNRDRTTYDVEVDDIKGVRSLY